MSHTFKHHFHDGQLASYTLGPRRELALEIALDPVWNKPSPPSVSVRFGSIENFDEVATFFRSLHSPHQPGAYITEVTNLQYSKEEPNSITIILANHGRITVQSSHVTES